MPGQPIKFGFFEYGELPTPTSIRLLRILPPEERSEGISVNGEPVLQCATETVDLKDSPEYNALSYTWGYPFQDQPQPFSDMDGHGLEGYKTSNRHAIAVNGRLVFVTKNLYEGLRHFQPQECECDVFDQGSVDKNEIADASDVNIRFPPYNKTPLIRAAEKGAAEYVHRLLRRGADVNAKDTFGVTALHYAVCNGHYEVVKLLVWAGADMHLKDSAGHTALRNAEEEMHCNYMEILEFMKDPSRQEEEKSATHTLLDLRDDEQQSLPFWIDAICINQEDVPERNAQVAIMSQIYTAAKSTIVWLGIEDEHTELAKRTIRGILNGSTERALLFRSYLASSESKGRNLDMIPGNETSKDFRAILALMRRAWFERIWIVQEVALARDVKMFCGMHAFAWTDIFEMTQRPLLPLLRPQNSQARLFSEEAAPFIKYGTSNRASGVHVLGEIRMRTKKDEKEWRLIKRIAAQQDIALNHTWNKRLTLPILQALSWNFQAMDPRDKIIALLSLYRPLSTEEGQKIVADYSKSAEVLFTEVGLAFVRGTDGDDALQSWQSGETEGMEKLEGLSFVQALDSRLPGLPSWVPDVSAPLITNRLWRNRFTAATVAPCVIQSDTSNKRILKLSGMKFDKVVQTFEAPEELVDEAGLRFDPRSWFQLALSVNPSYPSGGTRVEALWRTLSVDENINEHPQGSAAGYHAAKRSFKQFFRRMDGSRLLWDEELHAMVGKLAQQDESGSLPTQEETEALWDGHRPENGDGGAQPTVMRPPWDLFWMDSVSFEAALWRHYRGRRLFKTRKGYMGLGPRSMKSGDQIWLVAGARTPFVMREADDWPDDGFFQLVGETFVHGIMYGEAAKEKEDKFEPIRLV